MTASPVQGTVSHMVVEAVGPFLLLITLVMMVATGALLWSLRRLRGQAEREERGKGSQRPPSVPGTERRARGARLNGRGQRRAS